MRNPHCQACLLYKTCKTVCVWGVGLTGKFNGLFCVGEAPGADEDLAGIPFIGRAGKVLSDILAELNIDRNRTYITNSVKCRPPINRTPDAEEVIACRPYLLQEIKMLRPKVIVTLGKTAFTSFFPESAKTLGSLAKIRECKYKIRESVPLIPTYHPASIFHTYAYRKNIVADLKKAKELL